MQRAHTYLTWEQLAKALGLPGRPIKVWVEPDNDYVHIMLEDESFEERPDALTWKRRTSRRCGLSQRRSRVAVVQRQNASLPTRRSTGQHRLATPSCGRSVAAAPLLPKQLGRVRLPVPALTRT
jgi:hypothetical protein